MNETNPQPGLWKVLRDHESCDIVCRALIKNKKQNKTNKKIDYTADTPHPRQKNWKVLFCIGSETKMLTFPTSVQHSIEIPTQNKQLGKKTE